MIEYISRPFRDLVSPSAERFVMDQKMGATLAPIRIITAIGIGLAIRKARELDNTDGCLIERTIKAAGFMIFMPATCMAIGTETMYEGVVSIKSGFVEKDGPKTFQGLLDLAVGYYLTGYHDVIRRLW